MHGELTVVVELSAMVVAPVVIGFEGRGVCEHACMKDTYPASCCLLQLLSSVARENLQQVFSRPCEVILRGYMNPHLLLRSVLLSCHMMQQKISKPPYG